MNLYPQYDYGLVTLYMHDVLGPRIVEIQRRIQKFILNNGPILEGIYQNTIILESKPFGQITPELIDKSLCLDISSAERGLKEYNDIFNEVTLKLMEATSHEGLSKFLAENNISSDQIRLFASEIQLNWEATYGKQIQRIAEVKILLEQIRDTLKAELEIMKDLSVSNPHNFVQTISENKKLNNLLYKEREIFFQIMKVSEIPEGEFNELESKIKTQLKIVQLKMNIYRNNLSKIGKNAVKEAFIDLATSKTDFERAVIILSYLLSAYKVIITIPARYIVKGSLASIKTMFFGKRELQNITENSLSNALSLLASTAGLPT